MEMEIRAVVHYFYLTGVPAASAAALLQATYKDQSMTRTGVLYWYREFRNGRKTVTEKSKPGRPLKNETTHAIQMILEEFPYASARYISTQVPVSLHTVTRIPKEELHLKKTLQKMGSENFVR